MEIKKTTNYKVVYLNGGSYIMLDSPIDRVRMWAKTHRPNEKFEIEEVND